MASATDSTKTSDKASSRKNESTPDMLEMKFRVTAKDGLSLGFLDEDLAEGDEVMLKEDVGKHLLREGVVEPA